MGAFCTNCGTPLPEGAGFCPKCGTKVEVLHCPSCGKELDFGVDFCIYCGQRLKEEPPASESERGDSTPLQEITPQPEPEIPQEKKKTVVAEETPAKSAERSDVPKGFTWCYTEGADEQSHTVSIRVEGRFLYIVEGLFLTTNAEADFAARQNEGLAGQKIDLSEIKEVEIRSGYLVITEWSGNTVRVKGQKSEPEILREAAETILSRIGKDPGELQEEPLDGQPQEFTWSQVKPQGRVGSAVTTVRVWLEQEMLHIQKEFSDTITTHKNTLPEEAIPLSEIKSVYTQKKGPAVSVILLFLCVALVLYGGVSGTFDFGITALCLLGLVVMFALRYRRQMKRYQLVIVRRDGKKIVLKGNGDSLPAMDEAAQAILTRAGIDPSMVRSAGKRAGHKPLWIILGVVIVLILGVLLVPELYLKQSFPASVIQNQNVKGYVGTGISGDLNYQFATEVTGGKLVKNTSMPQYKDGLFTYYFVDCVYDVTITADDGESASGQVTVNCSFSVKPFGNMPENTLLNSFAYSDTLESFINEKSSVQPGKSEQPDKSTQPADSTLPDDLPLEFTLSSGAGGWSTFFTLNGDGTFEGTYSDMDMGGEPTVYQSVFSGAFDGVKRINDYTYTMTLNELDLDRTPGEEWYNEDGVHMIVTEPVGLELGETYYLYTPEAPFNVLPQNLPYWIDTTVTYVLCMEGAENGFVSETIDRYNRFIYDETGSLTVGEKMRLREYNNAQRDQGHSVTAVIIYNYIDDTTDIDSLVDSWWATYDLYDKDAIILIKEDSGNYWFNYGPSFSTPDEAWEILQQGVEESDTWGEAIMYYIEKIQ